MQRETFYEILKIYVNSAVIKEFCPVSRKNAQYSLRKDVTYILRALQYISGKIASVQMKET